MRGNQLLKNKSAKSKQTSQLQSRIQPGFETINRRHRFLPGSHWQPQQQVAIVQHQGCHLPCAVGSVMPRDMHDVLSTPCTCEGRDCKGFGQYHQGVRTLYVWMKGNFFIVSPLLVSSSHHHLYPSQSFFFSVIFSLLALST